MRELYSPSLAEDCLWAMENGKVVRIPIDEMLGLRFYELRDNNGRKKISCLLIIFYPNVMEIQHIFKMFIIHHEVPGLALRLDKLANSEYWEWLGKQRREKP